ncbi:MAG: hypothetical protein M1817_003731 [Caeruleum heppii]|nr:MAG: hypothetical protein M1817_003731 [Caeruleum heppii]
MATDVQIRVRGRPAHTPGPTYLTYTPNGQRLITAGSNNAIRIYTHGSSGEPHNVDDCQEANTGIVASNDFFITASEDGMVCLYSLQTRTLERILVRCTLPVRDIALSPDGEWVAVASDELVVKLVNVDDNSRIKYLREQPKPVKHVSFHPGGSTLLVSCSDGVIYAYDLKSDEPLMYKKIDGIIRSLETDVEATSRAVYHPQGKAFAVSTATREIQVVSHGDWQRHKTFANGHTGDITAIAWSPNGALMASAGTDRKVLLWETASQTVVAKYNYANVMNIVWHPTENVVSFVNTDGELYIYSAFVSPEHVSLLQKPMQAAPMNSDPLADASLDRPGRIRDVGQAAVNGHRRRKGTPDSLDDILGSQGGDDQDDFLSDDDGAGYAEDVNGYGKRMNADVNGWGPPGKRQALDFYKPRLRESFQPGSTPWRGDRRYLCLNLTGCVWTVDQDTHHTMTVEFYDRDYHRDFHFTDPFRYDKACLNEAGSLFSCPPGQGSPAMIFYRPHETWTSRADWRTTMPQGEDILAISLSDSYIVVTTTANYVRVFTLYGTPLRVYRQKSSPMVTCASWRDYVLTMGNGAVGGDGKTRLLYTIENVKRDEVCQSEDVVALTEGAEVKSVFFSDNGDPCVYDSTGVLLMLLHWRTPGQARWVPVLDTKTLARLAGGRKEESYWPVAVAQDRFHCIILKGGERYPYFPRPLLSDFEFQIPLSTAPSKEGDEGAEGGNERTRLEESFVRQSLGWSLLDDVVAAANASHSQRAELTRKELELDKILLQLLAVECREGEERGMKALGLVDLMRDGSGRMLEAAVKVAGRYGRSVLEEKIREVAERRLRGEDEG